jgi:hypothetical protein
LLALVDELGVGHWARVAAELGTGRTDNQCWRRWLALAGDIDEDAQRYAGYGPSKVARVGTAPARAGEHMG